MNIAKCRSFCEWRSQAKEMLENNISPDQLSWSGDQQQTLFDNLQLQSSTHKRRCYFVPKAFLDMAETAACLRDQTKWSRLYRILWRLIFEDRNLLSHASDQDIRWLNSTIRSVHRDCHKMKAFVRFSKTTKIPFDTDDGDALYVAWFEPNHLIVERMAPFFMKRFTSMTWSILTPDRCCHWDGSVIEFSQGISKPSGLNDELNTLWLTYYASIFNPARIKIKAMLNEMPKSYWKNLPEAQIIRQLVANSSKDLGKMFESTPINPDSLRDKSKRLKRQQDALRMKYTS